MVIVEVGPVEPDRAEPVRLTVRNETDEPISFTPIQLESPSLAYEVVDADSQPVPQPPPPVPDPVAEPFVLEPGASWETVHPAVVPDGAGPGRYRIRARLFLRGRPEPIHSDWHDVRV